MGGQMGCWESQPPLLLPNFRLISISIAVASFSLLRHAPQVAEVTQGLDGVAKVAAGVEKVGEGVPRRGCWLVTR